MRRAAAAAALALLLSGCGGAAASGLAEAKPPVAKRLLERRLRTSETDYRWVACVRVGRTFRGVPVTRCNVDFGIDPHVEAYCVVLDHGRLLTDHEDVAIPCGHDDAGWKRTTIVAS